MIEEKCLKLSHGDYEIVSSQLRKAGQIKTHEVSVQKMVRVLLLDLCSSHAFTPCVFLFTLERRIPIFYKRLILKCKTIIGHHGFCCTICVVVGISY